jgi:hypothetical protein
MLQLECARNCASWPAVQWEQFGWLYKRAVSSDRSVRQPTQASWNCAVGPKQCREQDNQMNRHAKFGRRMFRMQNTPLCTNLIPIILRKSSFSERNTGPVTGQAPRYQHCVETRTVYSPMASFITFNAGNHFVSWFLGFHTSGRTSLCVSALINRYTAGIFVALRIVLIF